MTSLEQFIIYTDVVLLCILCIVVAACPRPVEYRYDKKLPGIVDHLLDQNYQP